MIILSRLGDDHRKYDINRQDVACVVGGGRILFSGEKKEDVDKALPLMGSPIKFVMDGCGGTPHPEVGAKLFAQFFAHFGCENPMKDFETTAFRAMLQLKQTMSTDSLLIDNASFTILACFELPTHFVVKYIGDGYLLGITKDGILDVIELDDHGGMPPYLAYNYVKDRNILTMHQENLQFETRAFPKAKYVNAGVATDGWRFLKDLEERSKLDPKDKRWVDPKDVTKWHEAVLTDKAGWLSQVVNKNSGIFRDDLAICI